MKHSFKLFLALVFLLLFQFSFAQDKSDNQVLADLVNEFLTKVDSREMHDRFWADDLIYTTSSGKRFGKATIMEGFGSGSDSKSNEPTDNSDKPTYSAEDIQIQLYQNTAIVAFRLISISSDGTLSEYLNSGTFVKRNGEWSAVNWQATKIQD